MKQKGILEQSSSGIWVVKWSDLHGFSEGTIWTFTELHPESNLLYKIKDGEIISLPLKNGEEVEFELFGNPNVFTTHFGYAKLVFSEVEAFKKENLIKEYVKNGGELFSISNIDIIRDGGTKVIEKKGILTAIYIHKDNWTLHYSYPTSDENIITNEATKVYIMDRIHNYYERCVDKVTHSKYIIERLTI
jgi:hypothetical protein